jgi:bacteriorhodopsin
MNHFLQAGDYVGVSFWIVSVAMVAATVFFFYEGMAVKKEWRLSMTVAGLVTLVAVIHYYYMRDYWIAYVIAGNPESPIVYRSIDWLITVPLLMIEFYIILKAVGASVSSNSFWRLLVGTLVMLMGGFLGEAQLISATLGFIIGMIGWAVIIWEIFGGEASKAANSNAGIKSAFNALRIIVLVGWAIYPLGYIFGYMMDSVDEGSLNIIYNLADFVNKILFGLIIWNGAVKESA